MGQSVSDPEERKHRSYSLTVATGALILTALFSWRSDQAQQTSVDQQRLSLRKQEKAFNQQAELYLIQALQNPQELICSDVARTVFVEEDVLGNTDTTKREWDEICRKVEALPASLEVRRELISLLVSNPAQRIGIIAAYHDLYGDNAAWIDEIAAQTGS